MKVLLVNGSPHAKGCTYTSLMEVGKELQNAGIEIEVFNIGVKPIAGCISCGSCAKTGKCAFGDIVNDFVAKALEADGFVFGCPVYYGSMNGSLVSFMDRAFYVGTSQGAYRLKPACAVVNARRGGNSATFDEINKYFTISEMPVVSSNYWNQTHGNSVEEVVQDIEGMQTMRILGKNMAWLLKTIEAGKSAGIKAPEPQDKIRTNFIR